MGAGTYNRTLKFKNPNLTMAGKSPLKATITDVVLRLEPFSNIYMRGPLVAKHAGDFFVGGLWRDADNHSFVEVVRRLARWRCCLGSSRLRVWLADVNIMQNIIYFRTERDFLDEIVLISGISRRPVPVL